MSDIRQTILCPSCGKDACGGPWPVDQVTDDEQVFPCLICGIQFIGWREGNVIHVRLRRPGDPGFITPVRRERL